LRDLDYLLENLCVEWGFCTHLTGKDLMPSGAGTSLTASEFARAVLRAENMSSDEENWAQRIEGRFVARFGASVSLESYAQTSGETD
jgi:hypothetical protein